MLNLCGQHSSILQYCCCYSVSKMCPTLSDSMDYSMPGFPVLPCPSPRVCSNSCPSRRWCYPTISASVVPFSSCPQSFPASGSFPVSQLFVSCTLCVVCRGGQTIGISASASVLPTDIQDWFPLGWTGWISLQKHSEGLLKPRLCMCAC